MQRADTTLIAGTALSYAPYVVVLPYDALYLNDVVNTTLAAMRSDGRMEQIAARWLTIPLPPCPPDA
jgi:ABC-type amino acid transport substrate-binding protein